MMNWRVQFILYLTNVIKIAGLVNSYQIGPCFIRVFDGHVRGIHKTILLAVTSLMAYAVSVWASWYISGNEKHTRLFAILAKLLWFIRTFGRRMSLQFADSTFSGKHSRIGAVCLGVTIFH